MWGSLVTPVDMAQYLGMGFRARTIEGTGSPASNAFLRGGYWNKKQTRRLLTYKRF
jgi:hypothetical protein